MDGQAGPPAVQVFINGYGQPQAYHHGGVNGAQQRLMKPLSVDEALQYSPMTSAPIFGLGPLSLISPIAR
jgi:cohesin loading factor subunit SCC2